ncbi:amino acid deaminase [Microbacterium halotolerans]|uniref:amino acid deaminase n=1 Tax=Microbacterium halotolerans TaxID=246613 RepID=UPI000E6A99F4|nr:amino acid deaminase [Microbacterium halotolerans]
MAIGSLLGIALRGIRRDAADGRLSAWGRSTVVDENVAAAVIDRELFDLLHAEARIDAEFPVGNAGLVHVYGYFFSEVVTPYGYKRDRWTDGVLAARLGMAEDAFLLRDDAAATPLERVTAAALPLVTSPPEQVDVIDQSVDGVPTRAVVTAPGVLAYAVDGSLVTVFPVADAAAFAAGVRAEPPRLRWNAVAPH